MSHVRLANVTFSASEPAALLLDWFSRRARALPWREDYSPYKILVSEFMLQQTQVETVLPYFERWMSRYPDLASLAEAREADAEKLWEGLGYYARCRNLLAAARAMVGEGYAEPPPSAEALLKYPGIGLYTAGAVASIAYNIPVPAVDGNVERVTARLFDAEKAAGSPALKEFATEKVLEMMPRNEARAFNQALMELGALVCLPSPQKKPLCGECPWGGLCLAKARGVQSERPLPKVRPSTEKISAWGMLIAFEGAYLLRRRPAKGLWANFWEIPWFERTADAETDAARWGREFGVESDVRGEIGTARFSFTHHEVTARLLFCDLKTLSSLLRKKIEKEEWGLYDPDALRRLTLPAPSRKFLALLEKKGQPY
jgi:A/G-specific adenine glycosylase